MVINPLRLHFPTFWLFLLPWPNQPLKTKKAFNDGLPCSFRELVHCHHHGRKQKDMMCERWLRAWHHAPQIAGKKRETRDLAWVFETQSSHPATHLLQSGHTFSNHDIPPNLSQQFIKCLLNKEIYEPMKAVFIQTTTSSWIRGEHRSKVVITY